MRATVCGFMGEEYQGAVQEWDAVLGLCTAMLTNCKRVAEQLMDCTSVYKEVSKHFLDNF